MLSATLQHGLSDYAIGEKIYCAAFFAVAPDKLRPHAHAGVEFIYVL